MQIARLSKAVRDAEAVFDHEHNCVIGFTTALDRLASFLESQPQAYSFRLSDIDSVASDSKPFEPPWERAQGLSNFRAAGGMLKGLVYASTYAMGQQCDGLVNAMNRSRHLLAAQCARTLLEHATYQNEMVVQVLRHACKLDDKVSGKFYLGSLELTQQLVKLLAQRRFDTASLSENSTSAVLMRGKDVAEDFKATNIMTLIEKLPPDGDSWLVSYHLLSEYVHPNIGSRILFIDSGPISQPAQPTDHWTVTSDIDESKALDHMLALLSGPVVALAHMIEMHTRSLLEYANIFEGASK